MIKKVVIKKSTIHGKGIFALRDFKKGDVVIKWRPKIISKKQAWHLSGKQRIYLQRVGRKYYLMQSPEKFVNHSNCPNTFMRKGRDVAKRAIKKGEEITTRYNKEYLSFIKP